MRFFTDRVEFELWQRVWKTWVPSRCKFFSWLLLFNRCWTSDRLARHGLPHPHQCPLCGQEDETGQHLIVSCVFAREVWFSILRVVGLQHLAPNSLDLQFVTWWRSAALSLDEQRCHGFKSLVILVDLEAPQHMRLQKPDTKRTVHCERCKGRGQAMVPGGS